MKKNNIRKKYILYRNHTFFKKNINYLSYLIFFNLKKISKWDNMLYYHIFIPIRKFNEINTFIIINFLMKKNKYVTIPFSNFKNISIKNYLFQNKYSLIKNKYGILEPNHKKNKKIISPKLIDVIFIPLIIFDLKGYRIGYGMGFYDRFVQLCKKEVIKIGLSLFSPIKNIENIHKDDLKLDIVVTTNNIYFFKKKLKKKFKNIPYNNG